MLDFLLAAHSAYLTYQLQKKAEPESISEKKAKCS